ncbi:hypothetical protein Agabi119p4_4721 [Agaricus bisporus var. burnettii]|uniref:BCD1 alpha/beta domain-containing protein n=1 Tax=Agaricus bisporus var. burnettii TaxID=192524 RepID=A0A8H7KHM8_AGABI|nr:hypothetical protein Agabi119p4_4721 [Agaricus bisporus var. burnettii]
MDDYTFLEDVGRKVGEWGKEIVKGGFDMNVDNGRMSMSQRGRGRGDRGRRGFVRGGRDRGGRGKGGKGKREILKVRLEEREIEVELLPHGMERRQLNQSFWNMKTQTASLTIQFKFHPPTEASGSQSFTLLTHRNSLLTPLLSLVQKHIQDYLNRKTVTKNSKTGDASSLPAWLPSLMIPPLEDPENFTIPMFTIAAPSDLLLLARSAALLSASAPAQGSGQVNAKPKAYYNLDPNQTLLESLRGTQFVEFPMIEVWQEFSGIIVDKKTGNVRCMREDVEPRMKRRKLNAEEGRKAITGLVGDYGSDHEGDEGLSGKEGLVGYAESESDEMEQDNTVDEEIEVEDSDEDNEVAVDPASLLELIQRAKREGNWEEELDNDSCSDNPGDDDT